MGRDENTPAWVQHLARKVGSYDELVAAKAHLTANGVDVLGPTHHGIFKSIYFFDPNGHRVELACDIGTDTQYAQLRRVAPLMLDECNRPKKAPSPAPLLHMLANEYVRYPSPPPFAGATASLFHPVRRFPASLRSLCRLSSRPPRSAPRRPCHRHPP